jgi:hypothetical protein
MPSPRGLASAGGQRARRALTTPFSSGASRPLLVHAAHHRGGTVWFFNVYRRIAQAYGLRVMKCPTSAAVPPRIDVALYEHAGHIHDEDLGDRPVRGTHVVRDPRDVIVSSYFYHRWTSEAWVHKPDPRLGGRGLQDYLLSVSKTDGLMAEIERFLDWELGELTGWDYTQPGIMELRYEDVLADEDATFRQVFEFLGFSTRGVRRAVTLAGTQSFHRVSGRTLGQPAHGEHLRSGEPGQWKLHFEPRHIEAFTSGAGDLLARLGYDPDGASSVPPST